MIAVFALPYTALLLRNINIEVHLSFCCLIVFFSYLQIHLMSLVMLGHSQLDEQICLSPIDNSVDYSNSSATEDCCLFIALDCNS